MDYTPCLPHDIILQILCRLPAKTLVRFCCVCKSWQNLITSDQSLINSHLQNQAPRTLLLHICIDAERCSCESIPDVDAQGIADADHNYAILRNCSLYLGCKVYLVGSSRGLLCFEKECGCGLPRIFLWNPALRQCRVFSSPSRDHRMFALGFDFDPVTEDYKIVRVCGVNLAPPHQWDYARYEVGIYSLKNHSWKTKTISYGAKRAPGRGPRWDSMGVILEGILYWIQWTNVGGKVWVNAFDINREVLEAIFIPDHVPIRTYHRLRLFQGYLSISGFTELDVFELWVREQSSANSSSYSWVKQFAIPKDNLDIQPILSTTDVTACGKILATIAPEPGGATERGKPLRRFVLYNPETGGLENLTNAAGVYYDRWKDEVWYKYFLVDNFVESLVSIVPPGEKGFPVHTPSKRKEKKQNAKNTSAQKLFGCLPSCFRDESST